MTTQDPLFVDHLAWSGSEPTPLEELAYSDGFVAMAIGCASVLTCGLAAIAISLGFALGGLSR